MIENLSGKFLRAVRGLAFFERRQQHVLNLAFNRLLRLIGGSALDHGVRQMNGGAAPYRRRLAAGQRFVKSCICHVMFCWSVCACPAAGSDAVSPRAISPGTLNNRRIPM